MCYILMPHVCAMRNLFKKRGILVYLGTVDSIGYAGCAAPQWSCTDTFLL